jgi:hypothetical protein
MWEGHEACLSVYGRVMCEEWMSRGYRDTRFPLILQYREIGYIGPPEWMGDYAFHLSHRSNLVRKFPKHYRKYWPDVPADLPYVWPV